MAIEIIVNVNVTWLWGSTLSDEFGARLCLNSGLLSSVGTCLAVRPVPRLVLAKRFPESWPLLVLSALYTIELDVASLVDNLHRDTRTFIYKNTGRSRQCEEPVSFE